MTKYDQFLKMLEGKGFEQVLVERFILDTSYTGPQAEQFTVLWDGAVLAVVDSHNGEKVNSAKAYYNLRPNLEISRPGGSGGLHPTPEGLIWAGNVDIREMGLHDITSVRAFGDPMEEWTHTPHMWLVRSDERNERELGEFGEVIEQRKQKLPDEVQTAIGGWEQNDAPVNLYDADSLDIYGCGLTSGGEPGVRINNDRELTPISELDLREERLVPREATSHDIAK